MKIKNVFCVFSLISGACFGVAHGYVEVASNVKSVWGASSKPGSNTTFDAPGDFVIVGSTGRGYRGTCYDEYSLIGVVADQIVEHGGYFCPKQFQCTNKKKRSSSNLHVYFPGGFVDGNCAWLCEDGYTGAYCQKYSSVVPGMDAPTRPTDGIFSGVSLLTEKCWDRDNGVKSADQNMMVFHNDKGAGKEGHETAVVLGAVSFMEHGIKAAPMYIKCYAEDKTSNQSWIEKLGRVKSGATKLLCAEGYIANSSGSDCVRATAQALELRGIVKGSGKKFCPDWDETKYDGSIHTVDTSGDCIKFLCKDSTKAFPGGGDYSCAECMGNVRGGQDKKTGLCVKCLQTGQYFNVKTGNCENAAAYTTADLQYGAGKTKDSWPDVSKQCWPIATPSEYKECVISGGVQEKTQSDSTGDVAPGRIPFVPDGVEPLKF